MPASTPTPPDQSPWYRRRWFRRSAIGSAIGIVILILFTLLLPTLLSTGPGNRYILNSINKGMAGKLRVDKISLSWFSGQKFTGLAIVDPQGNDVVTIKSVDAPDYPFMGIAKGTLNLGNVTVEGVDGNIVQSADGTTNLERALAPTAPPKPKDPNEPGLLSTLNAHVTVKDAKATYSAPGIKPVSINGLTLDLNAPKPQDIAVKINAAVEQEGRRGSLDGNFKAENLFDASAKTMQLATAKLDGVLNLNDLPTDAVDGLLNANGAATASFGPTVTTTLRAKGDLANLDTALAVKSQHLNGGLAFLIQDGKFHLAPAADAAAFQGFKWNVIPAAFAKLTAVKGNTALLQLLEPFDIVLTADRLDGKLVNNTLDWASLVASMKLAVGDIKLDAGASIGKLTLVKNAGQLAYDGSANSTFTASLTSAAQYAGKEGGINVNASAKDVMTTAGKINHEAMTLAVDTAITQWPMAVTDQLLKAGGVALAATGTTLDASLKANFAPSKEGTFALTVASTNLNGSLAGSINSHGLKSNPGQKFTLTATPELFTRLFADSPMFAPIKSLKVTTLTIAINQLVVPFETEQSADTLFRGNVSWPTLALTGVPYVNQLGLDQGQVDLEYTGADRTTAAKADASMHLLGQTAPLSLTAHLREQDTLQLFDVQAKSGILEATLKGTTDGKTYSLTEPASFILHLTPAIFDAFIAANPDMTESLQGMRLAQPANLTLAVSDFTMPTVSGTWPASTIAATATLDQLVLTGGSIPQSSSIRNLSIKLPKTRLDQTITANLAGDLANAKQSGKLSGDLKLSSLAAEHPTYHLDLTASAFPVALADAFAAVPFSLVTVIGPVIDKLDVTADNNANAKQLNFTAKASNPAIDADLSGQMTTGELLTLKKGSFADLTLSPAAFAALEPLLSKNKTGLALLKPAKFRLEFDTLEAAFKPAPATGIDPAKTKIVARLTAPATSFKSSARNETVTISNLDAHIDAPDLSKETRIVATADTNITTASAPAQTGKIDVDATVLNTAALLDSKSAKPWGLKINKGELTAALALTDDLMGTPGTLAILGNTADITATGGFSPGVGGNLDVVSHSPDADAKFPFTVTKDMHLKLRQNGTVTVNHLNPALVKRIATTHPLFLGAVAADKPINVTFQQKTFDVPLEKFDTHGVNADIDADLGALQLEHGKGTLFLEKIPHLGANIQKNFHAAFTPAKISINKGVVTSSNDFWLTTTDLIPGKWVSLGLRIDGVDLATGTGHVRVAIPGTLLNQIALLNIDPKYIFEMTALGKVSDQAMDATKLVLKLVPMIAASASGKATGGNSEIGQAIGNLFGTIGGLPGFESQAQIQKQWTNQPMPPAPATQPAPTPTPKPTPQPQPSQVQPTNPTATPTPKPTPTPTPNPATTPTPAPAPTPTPAPKPAPTPPPSEGPPKRNEDHRRPR